MFNCSCCGTEVASPYFYDGGVYGWTCIKKVNPKAKKNKPKLKCVEVEVLKVEFSDMSTRGRALVLINGVKDQVTAYREYNHEIESFSENYEIGNFDFFNGKWWALA